MLREGIEHTLEYSRCANIHCPGAMYCPSYHMYDVNHQLNLLDNLVKSKYNYYHLMDIQVHELVIKQRNQLIATERVRINAHRGFHDSNEYLLKNFYSKYTDKQAYEEEQMDMTNVF